MAGTTAGESSDTPRVSLANNTATTVITHIPAMYNEIGTVLCSPLH